jgi:FixJ family two-component response regulator
MNSALPLSPAPPTVFVVDDDEQVRRALDRLLRSAGLAVRVFDSAPAFLEQAADQPGCLILDMKMPKVSGLDLQAILADHGLHMPVIFLTGHSDVPATVRAMKGGAIDFLTKRFRAKDLLAAVHAAL